MDSDFFRSFIENYVDTHEAYFDEGVVPSGFPNFVPNPAMNVCGSYKMELIMRKKMGENNFVVRESDPDYLKYFYVRGRGDLECDNCTSDWPCYNATIAVDLYECEVTKRYKQYCRRCHKSWASLYFTTKQFERIADRVIDYYKKRKVAGGTVPAIENNGSYSSKAFQAHEESDCERCYELEEPCWLHLVPYIKKVPYEIGNVVRSSLRDITEPLKKLYASATIEIKDKSKICRMHINPLSGSENIKQWRKQCEILLDSFLQNFNSISLTVQPDKQVVMTQLKLSLSVELQTVLHITGDKKKVAEALKRVENTAKEIKRQREAEKQKPCIILW